MICCDMWRQNINVSEDMEKRMRSTFGSVAESQVTLDTTITSIISEAQESVADQEDVANRKIQAWSVEWCQDFDV